LPCCFGCPRSCARSLHLELCAHVSLWRAAWPAAPRGAGRRCRPGAAEGDGRPARSAAALRRGAAAGARGARRGRAAQHGAAVRRERLHHRARGARAGAAARPRRRAPDFAAKRVPVRVTGCRHTWRHTCLAPPGSHAAVVAGQLGLAAQAQAALKAGGVSLRLATRGEVARPRLCCMMTTTLLTGLSTTRAHVAGSMASAAGKASHAWEGAEYDDFVQARPRAPALFRHMVGSHPPVEREQSRSALLAPRCRGSAAASVPRWGPSRAFAW